MQKAHKTVTSNFPITITSRLSDFKQPTYARSFSTVLYAIKQAVLQQKRLLKNQAGHSQLVSAQLVFLYLFWSPVKAF